jgi:beta-1,4-mannosyl-glycoprotein beta-1,4-N-acetylglucosaminyltransferase|tara:strand:- start:590 stop:1429 length:840 start_codon:yes stop_codon:yes gene_type:complete
MLDVRFNILNDFVHKFVVVESLYSHSGEKKKLNFDIKNYPKFKNKIIYLVIDHEPENIVKENLNAKEQKRNNSLKRIELSYNYMEKAINEAEDDDLIILSDNDEIPNLNSKQFKNNKNNIIIFKQLFFYYKFNLLYDRMLWLGSKACKKKYLKSFSWLRNQKNKKYPFWRLDTYFSDLKNINLQIIDDGGWHFTNVKSPEELFIKMKNFGHHDEFDLSGLTAKDLKKKIDNRKVFYNHFSDKGNLDKWDYEYDLKKIDDSLLPKYLIKNKNKYNKWFCL